jgi:hypothetical protein
MNDELVHHKIQGTKIFFRKIKPADKNGLLAPAQRTAPADQWNKLFE